MSGSGKNATSTQAVSIPPSVLAQYNSVNAQAAQTAQTPFAQYSGQFVAPVNATQQTGITGTTAAANEAQPAFAQATSGLNAAQSATAPINAGAEAQTAANSSGLSGAQIQQYLSPYLNNVLGSTEAIQNQENQQQQTGQLGTAISSGAFGGDRTGIAAANLAQQQQLANNQTIAGIANQGYQSALGTAQTEQGIGLQGAAQQAAIGQTAYGEGANTASELAGLGSGAQSAALQGAQAEIGAGTVQQQTQQAQDTAQYNQFLQQQSYPFQVDQFLANIAEGTGALSGSTTTTTQPGGFFSDKRLKHDIKKVGKTYDGQDIYSYKMHGDPRTHIGLIAQKVEKKHPEAVGLAAGYKTVDYGKATEKAANRGHFYEGGVVPRMAYAGGGPSIVDPSDLSAILQAQQQMYAPYSGGASGVYGGEGGSVPRGGSSRVPAPSGAHPSLVVAQGSPQPAPTGASETSQALGLGEKGYTLYKKVSGPSTTPSGVSGAAAPSIDYSSTLSAPIGSGGVDATMPAAAAGTDAASAAGTGAAADAAGTAVAGAGTAAAGDAAAEAAAALAAEYAAADVGAAAVLAAKRGGRMKMDTGGSPYSGIAADDPYSGASGSLDIPSDPNSYALKTAGPLKKIPTGFQDIMSMSNPDSLGTNIGNMFSNEALARGGVAGRAGFADGGSPDDADPDVTPAPAPSSGGGLGGWWDRNKGNILPVLSGLGAMGTARTVHPGVALAAGLEAAAGNYVPTQEGLAQVKGQQLQNQRTQMQLDMLRHPQNTSGGAQAPQITPDLGSAVDPASIASAAQSKLAVRDTWTPNENAALTDATNRIAVGLPNNLQGIKAQHEARIQNLTTNANLAASLGYQNAASVVNADPGTKFDMLKKVFPGAAWTLKDIADSTGLDPEKLALTYANQLGNTYHQYSNRGQETGKDGITRDKPSNQPLLGGLPEGMSAAEWANYKAHIATPVETGAARRPPLAEEAAGNGQPLVTTPVSPYVATPQSGAPGAAPARTPVAPGNAAPPKAPAKPQTDPNVVAGMPLEPQYQLPRQPGINDPQTPQMVHQGEIVQNARKELLGDSAALTNTAQRSLLYTQAAQQIMQSHGNVVGMGAGVKSEISRALKAAGITTGVDSTNYQTLSSFLANKAVEDFKQNFGARPAASEFNVQLNQIKPSPDMNDDTINNLLALNSKDLNYSLQTGHRAAEYASKNGDPLQFYDWNNTHFPRAQTILRPGQQTSGISDTSGFVTGKQYRDKSGNVATYLGNGQWK